MSTGSPILAPGWIVQLEGQPADLGYWHASLGPRSDPWCERIPRGDGVLWALRSRSFDQAATALEVRELALPLISRLNGALAASANTEPVCFQAVGRVSEQGEIDLQVFLEAAARARIRSYAHITAEVRDANGNLVAPQPPEPSEVQRWIEAAEANDDIADMLVFAGRTDNWFDIYKAVELAERLAGGERELARLLGDSARAFKNMRRTANFYRHARVCRPETPTTLAEAGPLLFNAVRTVLADKLK